MWAIARHLGRDPKTVRAHLSGERVPGQRMGAEPDTAECPEPSGSMVSAPSVGLPLQESKDRPQGVAPGWRSRRGLPRRMLSNDDYCCPSLADQAFCHRTTGRWWIAQHTPRAARPSSWWRHSYPRSRHPHARSSSGVDSFTRPCTAGLPARPLSTARKSRAWSTAS